MSNDFFTSGFIRLKDQDCYNILNINAINWGSKGDVGARIQQNNPGIDSVIREMQVYIANNILSKYFKVVRISDDTEIVEGLDKATKEWHHDFYDSKSNCGVLVYYDTMDEEIGGSLSIKRANEDNFIKFFPEAGDIVILNQGVDFLHKVDDIKIPVPRRVALFHFWIE